MVTRIIAGFILLVAITVGVVVGLKEGPGEGFHVGFMVWVCLCGAELTFLCLDQRTRIEKLGQEIARLKKGDKGA